MTPPIPLTCPLTVDKQWTITIPGGMSFGQSLGVDRIMIWGM